MPRCPNCDYELPAYRNPVPTVDIIIELPHEDGRGIVLVKRRNPPYGWALPGGFIDYGESAENAAIREACEETGLEVKLKRLHGVYSSPSRDPRQHTISIVFVAEANAQPQAGDDASDVQIVMANSIPPDLAFDHYEILTDYFKRAVNM